jgi:glycosyltransferase involved in cell wall biosynthesis
MKSILMVTTIPDTLKAFLFPFAHHLRARAWRVDAMACGISHSLECLQTFDRVWDVQWSRNPLDPRNLLTAPRIIQEVLEKEEYDIVHVHTPVAAFVTRYALKNSKKRGGAKIIYTAHGFHFHSGGKAFKNSAFLTLEKLAGQWTDYLVVMNREDEEAAKHHRLVSPEKVCYMPGIGLDLEYYSLERVSDAEVEHLYQELELSPKTPLLLSVAELIPRKHPQDVVKAFASLKRPDVCLAFAGNGSLLQPMQQLAEQLGVQNQVRFLGMRRDIPTLMSAAVTTILASEQEGLPRCVMESMCMETPVIGTAIRGTQDLVTKDCGFLVSVGDETAIAQAISWILDHPQEARIMGKKGRDRMATFGLSNIVKLHDELYADALSG